MQFQGWENCCGKGERRKGEGSVAKVLLLGSGKTKQWVQPRMSNFAGLSVVTTYGGKGLCAGVVSGGKVVLLVQGNAVSAAWTWTR